MKRLRPSFVCAAALALLTATGSAGPVRISPSATSHDTNQAAQSGLAPMGATSAAFRQAAIAELGQTVRVRLPIANGDQTLELTRFNPLAAGARVVEVDAEGNEHNIDLTGLAFYKGAIADDPDALAFVSVMGDRINGFVRSDEGVRVISTGNAVADTPISYELASDLNLGDGSEYCSADHIQHGFDAGFHPGHTRDDMVPTGEDVQSRGNPPCRVARIAVETDYEFTAIFGGNTTQSAAYALTLLAASSTVYERDVNVRLAVPFVRVFATNNDPYFIGNEGTIGFLLEMRDHWNTAMRHVPRETVHGLSGRGLGGGVAYVNALCNAQFGHGVSANLNGFFPMPAQDNQSANWDLMVVSHELGHNFGTGHTHSQNSYNPTIDDCGNGDCSQALDSTIMSYCHQCPGGIANMDMRFHPRVQERILEYLDTASCDLITTGSAQARDDFFELHRGQGATLDVLSNDEMTCTPAPLTIISHDATSAAGGTVNLATGGPLTGEQLFFTPAAGFTGADSFSYTTSAGTALVTVQVTQLREAIAGGTEPGVDADYFSIASISVLPDFDALSPFLEEVIGQIDFASTSGDFAGSGLNDNVAATFDTDLMVPEDGWYMLAVESDDGSRIWIGDDLIVDNDGQHGMIDRWNIVPLAAGQHPVRVEFFEGGGGAGLIMRYAGGPVSRRIVPASAFSRPGAPGCPADLAEPFGSLNFFDVVAFINAYNAQDPAADLAAPFGSWNFFDVAAYITLYNAGCP